MKLILKNLWIENYRAFRALQIERLGRANLIVGKNNTGKSSILEAVRLFAGRGSEDVLWGILASHDETKVGASEQTEDRSLAIKQLFHGREAHWSEHSAIRIGPIEDLHQQLMITVGALSPRSHDLIFDSTQPQLFNISNAVETNRLVVISSFGGVRRTSILDPEWRRWSVPATTSGTDSLRQAYVSPNGLGSDNAARLWDLIALTDLEDNVIEALRIISRDIERISFVGEQSRLRIPVAKLSSQIKPVPIRSLGDGVNRMLGIALALVSARGGVLLLDEVENGIHFSAQQQLWQLIFRAAHRLNIQVFATTHSWDCIEAFQRSAILDHHEEAALIRLEMSKNRKDISPTTFTEHDLSIVTRDQIEIR